MATIVINGKSVEVSGINVEQLRSSGEKQGNTGVMGFIRTAVNKAGAMFIVDLQRDLCKAFPLLPESQARVRINHFIANSSGKVEKAWAVYTEEPAKGEKDYKGQTLRIVCTSEWLKQARAAQEKEAEAKEFGIGD